MEVEIDITQIVKESIAKGEIGNAINKLLENEDYLTKNEVKEVTSLSARYSKWRKEKNRGEIGIGSDKDTVEFNKITYALLDILLELGFKSKSNNIQKDFISDASSQLKNVAANYKYLAIELEGVREAINLHKKDTESWCNIITFKDSKSIKLISQIYVELDCFLTPRRLHLEEIEKQELVKFEDVFMNMKNNFVILGQPGAGKTTTMKKVAISVLNNTSNNKFNFPLFIRLREFNSIQSDRSKDFLIRHLATLLGIDISYSQKFKKPKRNKYKEFDVYFTSKFISRLIIDFINNLNILVILDGFDELKDEFRNQIIREIDKISKGFTKSKFILTTRTGDYHYDINNTLEYEISSLSELQIQEFVKKWLNNDTYSFDLTKQINASPFADTAMRPLTLAHLCAYYERFKKIPEKPRTMYKKIINLLLEEWDLQRSIQRFTKYGKFDIDRKFDFLSHLAFLLSTKFKASFFTQKQIKEAYDKLCIIFKLPEEQYNDVLNELEAHNGLFLKSGYDNFEFAHKSIQEYLTAEYIVKLPEFPIQLLRLEFPNEMALAVSISSNPTSYFSTLSLKYIKWKFPGQFIESFLDRLIIEKPDFYSDAFLGISILRLYTSSVDIIKGQIIVKYARRQFIELSKWDAIKASIKNVFEHYKVFRNLKGGAELMHFDDIYNPFNYKIPLKLICDKDFMENTSYNRVDGPSHS